LNPEKDSNFFEGEPNNTDYIDGKILSSYLLEAFPAGVRGVFSFINGNKGPLI